MIVAEVQTAAAGSEISAVDCNCGIIRLRSDLSPIKAFSVSSSDDVTKSHVNSFVGTEVPVSGSDETTDPFGVSISSGT